jgi:hypothetical protein
MSASMIQAWGDGLAVAQSGSPAKFQINPNGQDMQGITFGVEGQLKALISKSSKHRSIC